VCYLKEVLSLLTNDTFSQVPKDMRVRNIAPLARHYSKPKVKLLIYKMDLHFRRSVTTKDVFMLSNRMYDSSVISSTESPSLIWKETHMSSSIANVLSLERFCR